MDKTTPSPPPGTTIHVRPRYADGQPKTGWTAALVQITPQWIVLRGPVQRAVDLGYVQFVPDDRMTERYWFDRWYNIFALHSAEGRLKGWYANLCTPIAFDGRVIRYTDLDLDLWVWPDRRYRILDWESFQNRVVATMPQTVVDQVHAALEQLLGDLQEEGPLFVDPFPLT